MLMVPFADVTPKSALSVRILANYARLEGQWYRPDEVFVADKAGWPADWEGRLLLALALHAQCTGRYPAYLDEILCRVPDHLNDRGYFGQVLDDGVNDEQQMAGHSWYLRGLLACRALGLDAVVDPLIDQVSRNLLTPSLGNYARYPLDPDTRWHSSHWKLSKLQKKASTHAETSDCGCAFIMLDGATALYEATGDPALKALIEEMVARYRQLDFEGLHVQTHATLSASRGILRMYELTGEASYLSLVKKVFRLYRRVAWTDAYGNYNWFGIPRWTEPCAIVDSYILATHLWQLTGDPKWLGDAHLIYHNALAHAQRATGAFGTDTCVGPAGEYLAPITYEVTWCCTMRGAEALTRAARSLVMTERDSVTLPFYGECDATVRAGGGTVTLRETTDFPGSGDIALEILSSRCRRAVTWRFFVPPGTRGFAKVTVNGRRASARRERGMLVVSHRPRRGDRIGIHLPLALWTRQSSMPTRTRPRRAIMFGPSILGHRGERSPAAIDISRLTRIGRARFSVQGKRAQLGPLWDVREMTGVDSRTKVVWGGDR